ncbi:MAG: hypothetical protein ACHQ4F_10840 [Candidatus Dormibacteria bacterium]
MNETAIIQLITVAVVGLAVIATAAVVARLGHHTRILGAEMRRLVDQNSTLLETAHQQAEGARDLAGEMRREGAIAARPLLVLLDEPPLGIREQPWAAVRVRNVGNGSALNFIVWMLAGGHLYRSAGAEAKGFSGPIHLAPGDTFEPSPSNNMLPVGKAHGYLDPGRAVVADDPGANLIAYCGDLSGNRYRFNLRTADPPDVWERGDDAPSWAGTWDPRLSSGEWPPGEQQSPLQSHPERDLGQLVEGLHDLVDALQDALASDTHLRVTGRASQRPHVAEPRRDSEPR